MKLKLKKAFSMSRGREKRGGVGRNKICAIEEYGSVW